MKLRLPSFDPDRLVWVGFGASSALAGLGWLVGSAGAWGGRIVSLLMTTCVALLVFVWWRVGPHYRHPLLLTASSAVPMLFAPPLFSLDVAAYLAQGRAVVEGLNPYVTTLATTQLPDLPVGGHWADTTSVYPPASLWTFAAARWLSLGHTGLGILWLRLFHVAALAVVAWVVRDAARRLAVPPTAALWLGLACPLLALQWVGGVHNDALLVAVLAAAAWAALRGGWSGLLAASALVGVAMTVKQSGAAAGPGIVALALANLPRPTAQRVTARVVVSATCALAVFAVISLASGFGFGWSRASSGSPLQAMNTSPLSWVAQLMMLAVGPDRAAPALTGLTILSGIAVLAATCWLLRRYGPWPGSQPHPWLVLVGGLVAMAVLGPGTQPWYFTWAAPFLIFCLPDAKPTASRSWHRDPQLLAVVALAAATLLSPLQATFDALPGLIVCVVSAAWLGRRWDAGLKAK